MADQELLDQLQRVEGELRSRAEKRTGELRQTEAGKKWEQGQAAGLREAADLLSALIDPEPEDTGA